MKGTVKCLLKIVLSLDFITASCPELMDVLSTPIFMLLLGNLPLDAAIKRIKTDILNINTED